MGGYLKSTTMKKIKYLFLLSILCLTACSEDFLDVNDNPNQLVDVPSGDLLFKGTILANTQLHKGHLLRSSMYYSGQLIGKQLVQQTIFRYDFTPGDSDDSWEHLYNGILVQNKKIRELSPNLDMLQGAIDVNEALALGTATTLWGDIPYSTAVPDNPTLGSTKPTYDAQASVYAAVQDLLDEGISKLQSAKTKLGSEDLIYNGDKAKWIEAAYSIKARNYLLVRDYGQALANAQKGISSPENDMNYNPIGAVNENSNLMYILVNGSRAGDMTGDGAFYRDLLDPASASSRNNAKTDETARRNFSYVKGDGSQSNGIDAATQPMPFISWAENTLIWAEALLRTGDTQGAIDKLNELRTWLNSGGGFNLINADDTFLYEPYEMADFESGGMENIDGVATDRAVLREIIEERYVSGFMTYMPFDDVRRLRKGDNDVMVRFPLNTTEVSMNPQRLLYPRLEIDNNENVPSPLPSLFEPTPINQ